MNEQANNSTNSQCSTTDTFIRRHSEPEGAESIITTDSSASQTPTIHLLQKTIDDANNLKNKLENELLKLGTVEHCLQLCEQHLSPSLFMLAKNNMLHNAHNGKKVIIKQNLKEKYVKKQLALTLYFFGPEVLHFFKKSFNLPSLETLKKDLHRYDMKPGLNDFVFNFIKFKISNFKVKALDCVLYADQISIKKHLFYNISKDHIIGFNQLSSLKTYEKATQALVFMIRGINFKWKQEIAYYLLSSCTINDLVSIVFSIIRKLQNIGLNVKAFVSDQPKEFITFSEVMNVSSNEPYFVVDDQRIIYIFNPHTLLRTSLDIFFKYSLHVNDGVVEKKYLDMYYNYISKLKYKHIHPDYQEPFDEIKVGLETQVFSTNLAARMSLAMNNGNLPKSSEPTINFINDMHKLFDIFNKSYKNITPQKDHLSKMTELFENMKVINNSDNSDITYNVKFINGWMVSISGLNMLWETLKPTINKEYVLCTHWLNKDFLDSLFDKEKKQNSKEFKPTSIQLVKIYKKLFYQDYFQYYSSAAKVAGDLDQIIIKINEQSLSNNIFHVTSHQQQNVFKFSPIVIGTVDYRQLNIPERNSLPYVCGYLMSKCLEKHVCEICINYAYCQKSLDQSFLLEFFKLHSYSVNSTPSKFSTYSDNFQDYIMELEYNFVLSFPTYSIKDNVGTRLKDFLCNRRLKHPCNLFDKTFLLNLYLRFRIFTTVRFSNKAKMTKELKLAVFTL